jgi:hypothetical protein
MTNTDSSPVHAAPIKPTAARVSQQTPTELACGPRALSEGPTRTHRAQHRYRGHDLQSQTPAVAESEAQWVLLSVGSLRQTKVV